MPTVVCNVSALAVATLYYYWRGHRQACEVRQRILHERVVYMLWVLANTVC